MIKSGHEFKIKCDYVKIHSINHNSVQQQQQQQSLYSGVAYFLESTPKSGGGPLDVIKALSLSFSPAHLLLYDYPILIRPTLRASWVNSMNFM